MLCTAFVAGDGDVGDDEEAEEGEEEAAVMVLLKWRKRMTVVWVMMTFPPPSLPNRLFSRHPNGSLHHSPNSVLRSLSREEAFSDCTI